jgi:hypothetical protein
MRILCSVCNDVEEDTLMKKKGGEKRRVMGTKEKRNSEKEKRNHLLSLLFSNSAFAPDGKKCITSEFLPFPSLSNLFHPSLTIYALFTPFKVYFYYHEACACVIWPNIHSLYNMSLHKSGRKLQFASHPRYPSSWYK